MGTSLRIPSRSRRHAEEILKLTDSFCKEHLDQEYAELCRKLVGTLARKRPSPLARGDLKRWAGAILYAVGNVNFLFDPSEPPFLSGNQICTLMGIPLSTLANKAKVIRDLLRLRPLDLRYCRRDLLERHPMAWMILVNGIMVDAREMPPEIQEEARSQGLIPDIPPDNGRAEGCVPQPE